ncbi:MAG: tetrahydrofolate synthase [Ignavibacteriales bacterium]
MISPDSGFNPDELFNLRNRGIKLSLDATREFLELTGNPQNSFKSFHVAGSVGKGSTTSFLASILMEAGYKTGLYTSPHFVRFNERIRVNGAEIDDAYIALFWRKYKDYILKSGLTFFEVSTVLGFCYFRDSGVEIAAVETGLGGRLDSTNLLNPLAVIITAISLEHTAILGNSVAEIAREKGGVIKPGIPVFAGNIPEEGLFELKKIAGKKKADFHEIKRNLAIYPEKYHFYDDSLILSDIVPPVKGQHQFINSALAIISIRKVLLLQDESVFKRGIQNVINNTGLEGRFEVLSNSPLLILDSAHNPAGITAFVNQIKSLLTIKNNLTIVFTALSDKNTDDMLTQLREVCRRLFLYELDFERGMTIDQMRSIALSKGFEVSSLRSPEDFFTNVYAHADNEDAFAVTGSMYLIGSFKSYLQKQKQIFI